MSLTNEDLDDDVVYTGLNRNFFLRKLYDHLPKGSFKLVCKDDNVAIELSTTRTMIFMERGETWKQMKRLLAKEHGDPTTWTCPVCFLIPCPAVLSTCDICLNSTCMKCFIEMFQSSCGKINCPFCRDDIGMEDLSPEDVTRIVKRLRADYCIPHP
jgi:hypothetical protein